jgi:protein-tyrosine phosphatase
MFMRLASLICHPIDTQRRDTRRRGKFAMTVQPPLAFVSACLLSLSLGAVQAQQQGAAESTTLVPTAVVAPTAGTRVIVLQGQGNFRDLGGYEAADGRHVKWGMIYRSGELSHLTDADYRRLTTLDIRTIYDLRDQSERASQPTVWDAGPVSAFVSAKTEAVSGTLSSLSDPKFDAARARAALADFYARMPSLYAPEYRAIVHELLDGHAPLLLHCTAGKDRSGVASALILAALGVPRATIVHDYELTDQLLKPSAEPPKTEFMRRFQTLPADVQRAMMSADPTYIGAAFQSIDVHYGSLQEYFSTELSLGPGEIKRLQSLYLQ